MARGYIIPRISIEFYSVAGPYLELEPYLTFNGEVINTMWEWELLGGLDGILGFEVSILSYSLANYYVDLLNWEQVIASESGDIGDNPPNPPSSPNPANNAVSVSINADLSWSCSDPNGDPLTYDVYFGTSSSPPQVSGNQSASTYDPGTLEYETTYYWKIVAKDEQGNSTTGSVWTFITTNGSGSYEQDFPLGNTGLTITMVWIPAGSFMQGAYTGEQGASSNEYPQHSVTLDYGFWLGKYEVTQGQWEAVTGSNPAHNYGVGADYPVYYVSWNMIHDDFIDELNNQTTGEPWRLPSESEWEYGCRAGTETRFYWGDDLSETMIDDYAVYYLNDPGGTAEVGTKLPNAWNLYDMSGNVWEWVEDYRHSNYNGAPTNGDPWLSPTSFYRVLRGGSWGHGGAFGCRSANRFYFLPSYSSYSSGFRIVRNL